MNQQQINEELHQRTVEVLTKLVDVLNCEDLSLLCFHCGVKENELMPVGDMRHPGELRKAA